MSSYANLNNASFTGAQSGMGNFKIDPSGKKKPLTEMLYKSWILENQYFESETGFRGGTYIDFTPLKKVFGLRIGEYREFSHKLDYYNNKGDYNYNKNHYFEVAVSYGLGADFKYDIDQNRFESVSLSLFGVSFEYSVPQSGFYQNQIYFGLDTGIGGGIGIGGFTNIKGGWKFNF